MRPAPVEVNGILDVLLHETKRQRIIRTLFLVCCLAPSVAVATWSFHKKSTETPAVLQQRFGQLLQARIGFAQFESTLPGRWKVQKLHVADLSGGQTMVTMPQFRMQDRGSWVQCNAAEATVHVRQITELANWILLQVDRVGRLPNSEVRLHIDQLHLQTPARGLTLFQIRCGIGKAKNGSRPLAWADFRLSPDENSQVIQLQLPVKPQQYNTNQHNTEQDGPERHNFQQQTRRHELVLNTSQASLPCWLLHDAWPATAQMGGDTQFSGFLRMRPYATGWDLLLVGSLSNLDMARLTTGADIKPIQTQASVDNLRLELLQGHIRTLTGVLQSGSGTMDASLLNTILERLPIKLAADHSEVAPQGKISFDRISLPFAIKSGSLRLGGTPLQRGLWDAKSTKMRAVMYGEKGPILLVAPGKKVSSLNLVHLLSPPGSPLVPTSPTAAKLLPYLLQDAFRVSAQAAGGQTPNSLSVK